MIYRKAFVLAVFAVISILAFGQQAGGAEHDNENIRIVRDFRMDVLLERFNKIDKVRGFRIQIHTGLKKEAARKTKSTFLSLYPDVTSYETYQQPYFNVTVGDFLTKIEAQHFLNSVREHFPNSFIVPEIIQPLNLSSRRKSE